MNIRILGILGIVALLLAMGAEAVLQSQRQMAGKKTQTTKRKRAVEKTDADWKKTLTPEQYHVMREKGTERAFTGKYWHNKESGAYLCAGCGAELFRSDAKRSEEHTSDL